MIFFIFVAMASLLCTSKFKTGVVLCGRSPCLASRVFATRWPWPKPHLASSHQWQFRECASRADEPLIESAPRDQSSCDSFLTVYYTLYHVWRNLAARDPRATVGCDPLTPSFPKHRIVLNASEAETLSDLLALGRLNFSIGTAVSRVQVKWK